MLSFMGFFCFIIAAVFLGFGFMYINPLLGLLAPLFIFLGGMFDIFDGEVARRTNKVTPLGAFLDSNLDRISDAAMILGLIFAGLITFILGYILIFLILMISYTRTRAEKEGVDMMGIGWMERGERVIIIFIALVAETWIYAAAWTITHEVWGVHIPYLTEIPVTPVFIGFIFLYLALLLITIFQRLSHALKFLNLEDLN